MTPDRIFYPLAALVAAGLIALAMVYPQGQGARSWGRFGHTPVQQTAAAIAQARRNAQLEDKTRNAAAAMRVQQEREAAAAAADGARVRTTPLK